MNRTSLFRTAVSIAVSFCWPVIAANQPNIVFILADDLAQDAGEKTDKATQHPDLIEKAARLMKEARTDNPNWPMEKKTSQRK